MRPTMTLSLLFCGFLVAATEGRTCEAEGTCDVPEEQEDSALLQAHKHNLTNTCDSCHGGNCCCEQDCGVIGGAHLSFDTQTGLHIVELKNNGYGQHIVGNTKAQTQCSNFLANKFANPNRINKNKPCCLYTGDAGFTWAVRDDRCNSLEGSSDITQITDAAGPHCHGCPKIAMCPGKTFPTMFWEVASLSWARFMNRAPNCHKEVFVLVPGVHTLGSDGLQKKISFRVELDGIASDHPPSDIFFVTDTNCPTLEAAVCGAADLKLAVTGGSLKNKVFCIPNAKSSDLKNIKSSRTKKAHPFTCHLH